MELSLQNGTPVLVRGTQVRLPLLSVAVLALAAVVTLTGCDNRLPSSVGGLPYELRKHSIKLEGSLDSELVDFDGDGVDELISFHAAPASAYYYLAVRRVRDDNILIMEQYQKPWLFRFSGVADVDGDGVPEVLVTRQIDTELAELSVLAVDLVGDNASVTPLERALPVQLRLPDTLIEGAVWDGRLITVGVSDGDGDGWNEQLTFTSRAGYALGPRGIGRGNLLTGEVVWFTAFAGIADELVCVADFDEDGEDEYAASFNSPGNGVTVGDMTDREAYVAAIDGDGSVMWRHRVAGLSASGWPYCGDVTRDGHIEVVTWQWYGRASRPDTIWLTLWSGASGERIGRWANSGNIYGVALGGEEIPGHIFVACEDGTVRRLVWTGVGLAVDRTIDCGGTPLGVAIVRVDPFDESIVACMTAEGMIATMDRELRPLAVLPTDEVHDCHASIGSAGFVGGTRGLSVGIPSGVLFLELARAPLPLGMIILGTALVAIIFCIAEPCTRRRLLTLLRRTLIPRADREKVIDELLGTLVRAGHGKLAVTTTLRRLQKQLTMLGGLESEPPEEFAERYREAIADVREIGIPGVEAIHREAARVGLKPSLVSPLRRELVRVRTIVQRLPVMPPSRDEAARLAGLLDTGAASLDAALDGISGGCGIELSSNLMSEIRRAAGARRTDFIELGAELTVPTISRVEQTRVLGTRAEVSFIVENLLGNSLAAVERSDVRHVEITVEPDDREIVMLVSDTGTGIPPDMHERIFDDGVTGTHGGSGHGLAESRRILSRRGGSIAVARSRPGQGTTLEVRFQMVDGGTS